MSGGSLPPSAGAGGLVVVERRREIVRYLARPLEHLALIVRAVGHLETCRNRRRLRFGETGSARIAEIAE
jgi:hypothetical protein